MRLASAALDDYLARVAESLERYGVALEEPDGDLVLEESSSGALSFDLRGSLPDGRRPPQSTIAVREIWRPAGGDEMARAEYEYELIDHERAYRRAFHRHDTDAFIRRFDVVVHEHCERPIGYAPCAHLGGDPVRDGYDAVEVLIGTWTEPTVPHCEARRCLDRR